MNKGELKQLLKDNLTIEIDDSVVWNDCFDSDTFIKVIIKFDNEIICQDKVRLEDIK